MLRETDMLGVTHDKVQDAIQRLKSFEPQEGYYLAFSGGKDSCCIKALADMAGVKYDAHYNATTVDPPQLVRFILKYHPDVEISKPEKPMRVLIADKLIPPTRVSRYCCERLKEHGGDGRVTITGTRWAESVRRANTQGMVTFYGKSSKKLANELDAIGADYRTTKSGTVLTYDNAETRRTVEQCYRNYHITVNPIIDWTDEDVWEFIHEYNIPYCELYDQGFKRLGCIGCPMTTPEKQKAELEAFPAIKKMYLKAFERMIANRKEKGKNCDDPFDTPEHVMQWWVGDRQGNKQLHGQLSMMDEDGEHNGFD